VRFVFATCLGEWVDGSNLRITATRLGDKHQDTEFPLFVVSTTHDFPNTCKTRARNCVLGKLRKASQNYLTWKCWCFYSIVRKRRHEKTRRIADCVREFHNRSMPSLQQYRTNAALRVAVQRQRQKQENCSSFKRVSVQVYIVI